MNHLSLSLAGALALTSSAALAQQPTRGIMPFHGEITYLGTINAATGVITAPGANVGPGLGEAIYNNTAIPPQGSFFSNQGAAKLFDEGRIPSTSSPNVVGTQDTYILSSLSLQYVTNATDPSLGGIGNTIEIELYESYAACSIPDGSNPPIATITLPGLPGSTTGGAAGFILDVDLTGLGICMKADGDGVYSDGTSDLFGWSFHVTELADATAVGPFLRGDPDNQPAGDATVFQNSGAAAGTGLDTQDLFARINVDTTTQCLFFGGYPANIFSSFGLILRSELSGGCIGCGQQDDVYEMNDDAANAAAIGLGSYNLVSDLNEDWFSYTISPNSELTIDALFSDSISDLDLRVYDAATLASIDQSNSGTDNEQVMAGNCGGAPLDVVIQILNFSQVCNEYTLVLTESALVADDAFEDNDSCDTGVALPLGVTQDLVVRPYCGSGTTTDDQDYYNVTLMPGETLNVDILFTDAITDIDCRLRDITAGCPGITLDTGFSTTDNESVEATNNTAAPMVVSLLVDWFAGDANGQYDMIATVGVNQLGEVICLGVDNSTGTGALLTATGDPSAAANDLTLDVTSLPMNSMGYFIVSQETNVVTNPGGSDGNICIASLIIGRYAGSVLNSGAAGAVSFSPDLTSIPVASGGMPGSSAAMAGDTYNFQLWYRDMSGMGAATSNFSSAVSITFQ
ncbi:hypothetical protein Poly30_46740 [Planctomycetes bacterium Poly30]|uniref:Uncharacterized protein n=1 Tax=Saltatorellus ferox TaxID=2528018 RepID=A0A518EYF6_9BACT|nr:hypothetical protein Poly30_46740 [Planctomycetes bacterium Poly30]